MTRISEPNYTQSPNVFYDEILRDIDTLAELKVTDIIIRYTFGYHKDVAKLSYDEFQELTGMGRQAIASGIKAALERGTIERARTANGFEYCLAVRSSNSESLNIKLSPVKTIKPPSLDKEKTKEISKEKTGGETTLVKFWETEIKTPVPGGIFLEKLAYRIEVHGMEKVRRCLLKANKYGKAHNLPYLDKIIAEDKPEIVDALTAHDPYLTRKRINA